MFIQLISINDIDLCQIVLTLISINLVTQSTTFKEGQKVGETFDRANKRSNTLKQKEYDEPE